MEKVSNLILQNPEQPHSENINRILVSGFLTQSARLSTIPLRCPKTIPVLAMVSPCVLVLYSKILRVVLNLVLADSMTTLTPPIEVSSAHLEPLMILLSKEDSWRA